MKRLLSILILVFIITETAVSQLYISPDATLFINKDATLAIDCNTQNDGKIVNPGTIQAFGNFDNRKYMQSTGTFVLAGKTQTFYHQNHDLSTLICNGGGIKNLINSINIYNSLELNQGLLKPFDSTILLLKNGAATTSGNSGSYVDGRIYTEGLQSRYFPVGRGGLFSPCEFISAKGDTNVRYGIELINPTTLTLKKGKQNQGNMPSRYWKMDVKKSTFTQAYVALSYSEDDMFANPDLIGVVQADDSTAMFDMLRKNTEIPSLISNTGLLYSTSGKPVTKHYFTLGDYLLVDMKLFFVPNALSHNSLDTNDRAVRVYGSVLQKERFSFVVSNQWGNVVFKTTSLDEMSEKGWDGTNSHTKRKETTGQYFYVVKGVTLAGENFEKAGSIWIID